MSVPTFRSFLEENDIDINVSNLPPFAELVIVADATDERGFQRHIVLEKNHSLTAKQVVDDLSRLYAALKRNAAATAAATEFEEMSISGPGSGAGSLATIDEDKGADEDKAGDTSSSSVASVGKIARWQLLEEVLEKSGETAIIVDATRKAIACIRFATPSMLVRETARHGGEVATLWDLRRAYRPHADIQGREWLAGVARFAASDDNCRVITSAYEIITLDKIEGVPDIVKISFQSFERNVDFEENMKCDADEYMHVILFFDGTKPMGIVLYQHNIPQQMLDWSAVLRPARMGKPSFEHGDFYVHALESGGYYEVTTAPSPERIRRELAAKMDATGKPMILFDTSKPVGQLPVHFTPPALHLASIRTGTDMSSTADVRDYYNLNAQEAVDDAGRLLREFLQSGDALRETASGCQTIWSLERVPGSPALVRVTLTLYTRDTDFEETVLTPLKSQITTEAIVFLDGSSAQGTVIFAKNSDVVGSGILHRARMGAQEYTTDGPDGIELHVVNAGAPCYFLISSGITGVPRFREMVDAHSDPARLVGFSDESVVFGETVHMNQPLLELFGNMDSDSSSSGDERTILYRRYDKMLRTARGRREPLMRAVDVARTLAIGDSHAFQLGGQDNVFVRLSNRFLLASTHMNADFDTFKAQVDACPYPARLVDLALFFGKILFFGKTVHLNTKAVAVCTQLGFAGTPETFDEKLSAPFGPLGIPRESTMCVFDSARAAKVGVVVSDWFALGGGEKEEFIVKLSVLRRSERFAVVSAKRVPATTWKGVRDKGTMFSFRVRNIDGSGSATYNDATKYGTKTQAAVARHKFIVENWGKWAGTKPKIEDVFR